MKIFLEIEHSYLLEIPSWNLVAFFCDQGGLATKYCSYQAQDAEVGSARNIQVNYRERHETLRNWRGELQKYSPVSSP